MSLAIAAAPDADEGAEALEILARESTEAGIQRCALLLRLSALPRGLAQPHHLRLAREAVAPLTVADRARRFSLPNTDLVLVWRGPSPALDEALTALRHLFADAPEPQPDLAVLAEQLSLPAEADRLLAAIDDSRLPRPPGPPAPSATGRSLDLPTLARLEAALTRADMTRFARRQPVCQWSEAGFTLAWEHRLLSLSELAEALTPGHDLAGEPWLLRRLTRTLDRRLLALLAAPGELRDAAPFGLTLNAASLLGPEFLRFDAALPPSLRGQVTLALHAADAMADPATFLFARDFARARQYRLMLCGVAPGLLDVLPRARLGVDLLQLSFSAALAQLDLAALAGAPEGLLLAGVDSKAALAWGRAHGIGLFQGTLVAPTRPRPAPGGPAPPARSAVATSRTAARWPLQ